MSETLSFSGKVRRRLAHMLWPQPAPPPPEPEPEWTFAADGLATLHRAGFLGDPRFREAYAQAKAIGAWHGADIEWRAYTVCWAASKAKGLEGDYVECGVDRGGFSRMAMHYVDFASMPERKFHLIDTFTGIPEETLAGDPHRDLLLTRYDRTYDDVVRTFEPFPNAVIVQGKVPEILPSVKAEKVCYLCIDLNTIEPSIAAAEFFWDRLVSGAPIILDDYGQTFFEGMAEAFDAFARRRGVEILALPTGHGLLFKP
jgi:O-methyltransferase